MCDFSQARGHGWWLGIRNLGPITSNYTPHQLGPHFFGHFFCWYIYPLSSLMSLHLFLYSFLFGSNSLSSFKSNQSQKVENATKMQKYASKMKAEVLDSRWYLFVCWLHMFGFGFPGFAGFPPSDRHSTLPANTLATITPHPHRISGISSPLMISKTQKYS